MPIVDVAAADAERIWPSDPAAPRLDFHEWLQRRLLDHVFPSYIGYYDYLESGSADAELQSYCTRNDPFSELDSRVAFCML